jgi:hypothetical protein
LRVLARLRISLPDRTGSLARIAAAVGNVKADVVQVSVMQSEAGRALDELYLDVVDETHLAQTVESLNSLRGVRVTGVACPAPPLTGHGDLDLAAQLVARPQALAATLADAMPAAFGGDWAVVVRFDDSETPTVVATSIGAPPPEHLPRALPLRLANWADDEGAIVVLPLHGTDLAALLYRKGGPEFHQSETWRLEQLGLIAGTLLRRAALGADSAPAPA